MKPVSIILICIICLTDLCYGQATPPIILPPSPQSSALISYNSPDVGLNTGTTQLSVPLFKIEKNNFSMPIGLRYSTNGLRVDEIATRTGQSWVLNAGGVITRSVNGKPDEYSTRVYPPNDGTSLDNPMLTYLKDMSLPAGYDAEPDEYNFNFNGYAGKFIIGQNGEPMLIPHSNLKISFSAVLNPDITIITPDGVKYEFKAREKSYINTYCYVNYTPNLTPIVTSWFLTKVMLPNGEIIEFSYDDASYGYYTGMSQSILKTDLASNFDALACNNPPMTNLNTYCANYVDFSSKRLSKITYNNIVIDFIYQNRLDIPGDKLLSSVNINRDAELINNFNFEYTLSTANPTYGGNIYNNLEPSLRYRPFLTALIEKGTSMTEEKVHRFKYQDINDLPQRLSFSQDHYGFFNGKSNLSFVPNVEDDPRIAAIFASTATADRSVDSYYSGKGTLSKISYPGGGSDSLVYEANSYRSTAVVAPAPTTFFNVSGTSSTSLPFIKESSVFQISYDYTSFITLFAGLLIPTDVEGNANIDPGIDLMQVEILRSSDNHVVFTRTLKFGQQINKEMTDLNAFTDYYIRISILYPGIKGTSYITYRSGDEVVSPVNKDAGGVRLSKMITNNGSGQLMVKKYYYSRIDTLGVSSGIKFQEPAYLKKSYSLIYPCTGGNTWVVCTDLQLSSHSQKSIYNYGQSSMQYSTVVESIGGENFENGGIEHLFRISRDRFSLGIVGKTLSLGDKYSNTGYLNGLEYETNFFKNNGGGLVKVKQVKNYHSVKTEVSGTIPGYVVNKFYDFPLHFVTPIIEEFDGFEMYRYTFNSRWVVLDSTIVKEYPFLGNPSVNKTSYVYNNSMHMQPNIVRELSSKNGEVEVMKNYPAEMVSLGKDPTGVYGQMLSERNLTPVIEEVKKINNQSVSFARTNYIMPYSGIFVPGSVDVQNTLTAVDETRLRYYLYNNFGNPLSLSKEGASKVNYIWSYNGQYPIAEIKNADYPAIEAIKGASAISTFGRTYPDKAAVDGFVAALKTGLPDAQITTYVYKPLVGVTSQTDAKGMTTYYEYDSFQRLKSIKDQQGNIVKSYDYHYKPQTN